MPSKENKTIYILIALATLAFGALFFTMPRTHDDYWFMADILRFGTSDDGSFSFLKGITGCLSYHHFNDNSRLSNLFCILVIALPIWFSAIISMLSVGLSLTLMIRISGARIAGATAIMLFYTFFIPWTDYLFSFFFTGNYIIAGAIMMAVIALFMRKKATNAAWMFILGIIFGAWHEIYSFPILVGAVACFVVHRKMIRPDRLWMCAGLFLGCLWLWMSPSRTNPTGYGAMINFHRQWGEIINLQHWVGYIFLFLTAIALLIKRTRCYALSPVIIFSVSCVVIGLFVHLLSAADRATTPAVMMSALGGVYLFEKTIRNIPRIAVWICGAAWVFFFIHMGVAFATGLKIRNEEKYIINEYLKVKDTDGVVYADVTTPETAPWLSFGKPFQTMYTYFSHPILVKEYYGGEMLKVIPTALRSYKDSMGMPIESNADVKSFKGHLIARNINVKYDKDWPILRGEFAYKSGNNIHYTVAYPFIGSDSIEYLFLFAPADGIEKVRL